MPQKLLDPLRKLPQQIQNLDIVKKLHDFHMGKHTDGFSCHLTSTYGSVNSPSCIAFDKKLGLIAVGSENGIIKIYGSPGVVYTLQQQATSIKQVLFLPSEGRLLSASVDGLITMFELDSKRGRWISVCQVQIPQITDQDHITCLGLGHGVLYVGSANGTLRQVAIKEGRMTLGDDALTACTSAIVSESVPIDKRSQLGVDSPIVSLEVQPEGNHLLIAYAGGCVAVAVPQPIPVEVSTQPVVLTDTTTAPTAEGEIVTPNVDDDAAPKIATDIQEETVPENKTEETTGSKSQPATTESEPKSIPGTPVKEHSEKRATLKLKALTRSLRPSEASKQEKPIEPGLPVPPAPRISHLLLRDQPVEWASWHVTTVESLSTEVTVAYGDGAFQVWPIVAAVSEQPIEPIIVSMRDPPSTPYGPLPCGAIKKILINPAETGGILTVFSGGLPRPQFETRHAVSVLLDNEHHVCFQFGSEIKDFILIPSQDKSEVESAPSEFITKPYPPTKASTLLVLTERELIGIDLTQPNWPVYDSPYLNCMNISPVTAINHIGQVPSAFIHRLYSAARTNIDESTDKSWPIWGGLNEFSEIDLTQNVGNDVIGLGHANGWVTLWAIGRGDTILHLGSLPTASLFNTSNLQNDQKFVNSVHEEETWPPFRQVGYCARAYHHCNEQPDPRLSISELLLHLSCPSELTDSGVYDTKLTLVVGAASGHVSVWESKFEKVSHHSFEPDLSRICAHLIDKADETKYVWKDAEAFRPVEGFPQFCSPTELTFYPQALVQIYPPGPITSLAIELSWNLLGIGSSHGFALIDLLSSSVIHTQFTFTQSGSYKPINPVSTVQNAIMERGRQLRAGMRQSFKRLKNLRTSISTTQDKSQPESATGDKTQSNEEQKQTEAVSETIDQKGDAAGVSKQEQDTQEIKKSETEIESKPSELTQTTGQTDESKSEVETVSETQPELIHLCVDDHVSSSVRSLLFADTYIHNIVQTTTTTQHQQTTVQTTIPSRIPSLWIGTSSGKALAYSLMWNESAGPVKITLCKELQLHHHAPIMFMCILDAVTHEPVLNTHRLRTSCVETVVEPSVKEPEPIENEQSDLEKTTKLTETNVETTTTTVQDSHRLLICSEEQVKLFSLPSLRAIYKHKFFDRLNLLNYTKSINTSVLIGKHEKENNEENEPTAGATGTSENEVDQSKPNNSSVNNSGSSTPISRKRVTGFGIQNFIFGQGDQAKFEWNAVATLLDGQTGILSLPSLRKIFKERCHQGYNLSALPCVATNSTNTKVFWFTGSQLMATELGSILTLNSLAVPINDNDLLPKNFVQIQLPEWVRPQKELVNETETNPEQSQSTNIQTVQPSGDVITDNGTVTDEHVTSKPELNKQTNLTNGNELHMDNQQSQTIGDVTIDSIKEYLNGNEGIVTVKTTECSTEKYTLVEGGKITTTVHEIEKIDGKITKNDIVKIVTDGEPESTITVTGTA